MRDAFIKIVESYTPGDEADSDFKRRTSVLLQTTHRPLNRNQFSPGHITASALVLSAKAESVLLIWHRKLQRWLQPGGHVEEDRDPFATAIRETGEETGILPSCLHGIGRELLDIDIHPIPATPKEPSHDHFDLRVLLFSDTKDIVPATDAAAARWFAVSSEETNQMLDASGLRLLRKGLRGFAQGR